MEDCRQRARPSPPHSRPTPPEAPGRPHPPEAPGCPPDLSKRLQPESATRRRYQPQLVREANRFRGQAEPNPGSMLPPAKEEGVWAGLKRFAAAIGIVVAISHAPIAIGEDIKEYRQELLSLTAEVPAQFVAPGPASAPALEASRSSDLL